jgi:hypothetical protein
MEEIPVVQKAQAQLPVVVLAILVISDSLYFWLHPLQA